jgi:hypothetical protein
MTETLNDSLLIDDIIARAAVLEITHKWTYSRKRLQLDLTATHLNGCPLDLHKLLQFDDFNFTHDITGIARHLDRTTGELRDCFVPRCAK